MVLGTDDPESSATRQRLLYSPVTPAQRQRASMLSRFIGLRRLFSSHSKNVRVAADKRTNIVFGANTDVGKTLVSAGLVRAALRRNTVHYVKPLQCGGNDQEFVRRHALLQPRPSNALSAEILFQWDTPTSPHIASRMENKPQSDKHVMEAVNKVLVETTNRSGPVTTIIETAGGVLSPSASSPNNTSARHATSETGWGWIPQADLYQPLLGQTPVVLVGDGRLGGISATLSSLESLLIRGYDVTALVLLETDYDNVSAMREYVSRGHKLRAGNGETLFSNPNDSVVSLPAIPSDPQVPLDEWYGSDAVKERFERLDDFLQQSWEGQLLDLQSLRCTGRQVLWWPFTQHSQVQRDNQVALVDSASQNDLNVLVDGTDGICLERVSMKDMSGSEGTLGIGHGDSSLALASAGATGRYGHVAFPQTVHAPAVALGQTLVGPRGPGQGWAKRVFFTEDAASGMEAALKMGMKTYIKRMREEENESIEWVICGQENSYHGGTLGVMNATEPSFFNDGQHPWYECKGLFLTVPTLGFRDGVLSISFPEGSELEGTQTTFESIDHVLDIDARMISRKLHSQYRELIEMQWLVYEHSSVNKKISSVVIEPVLSAVAGMSFVDPLWQKALIAVAESRNVPVIFDETTSGLQRLGVMSGRDILREDPDIGVYSKLLTGGILPLCATLTTEEIFETFLGEDEAMAMLHGSSHCAHASGCTSALHALHAYDLLSEHSRKAKVSPRMLSTHIW